MDKKKKIQNERKDSSPQQKISNPPSSTDPLGSYTGVLADPGEVPTQDADDL